MAVMILCEAPGRSPRHPCAGLAAPVVLLGGLLTPGYDPLTRTISRLAEPGLPASAAVALAIIMVGAAMLALAAAMGPGAVSGRLMLGCAGVRH